MEQSILHPFRRYRRNPILSRKDVPYACNTVFNAAAVRFEGRYLLVLRIEDLSGRSHLTKAWSDDGYNFKVEEHPWITPAEDAEYGVYEAYGVEDPRITRIEDAYYITYTAFGPYGPRVAIGRTCDFKTFERLALATEVDNKDAVLFPEKIDGKYMLIDRPGGFGGQRGDIWLQESFDMVHWGRARVLLSAEPGWGGSKLGISTPPIRTEKGWLAFYHGVRRTPSGNLYRLGCLLLDLQNPARVIGYTPHFIFGPEEIYERTGDVPNVIFPCGLILEEDGMLKMYYGAADTHIALAEGRLQEILALCSACSGK